MIIDILDKEALVNFINAFKDKYVVVVLGSGSCIPCRIVRELMSNLESDDLEAVYVDLIEAPDLQIAYDISITPTTVIYHNNEVVYVTTGMFTEQGILKQIDLLKNK